ncbi:MAG: hypothetical protein K0M56_04955 [Kaistella sp.]|nr:hypothetical protein [Kaistella sp.]
MKLKLFSFTLLFCAIISFAQNNVFLNIPKLSVEEVKNEKSIINPEAGAEVLYRSVHYLIDNRGNIVKNFF